MTRTYFNQMADIWDSYAAEKDRDKLSRMTGRLEISPGSTILDAGTGTGVLMPFILKRAGENVRIIALDFAESMLKIAFRKNFTGDINFICAEVTRIPLRDSACDAVVCYSSFPHFRDKPAALKEMNRVIKEGGQVFICHTSSRDTVNLVHNKVSVLAGDILPDKAEMKLLLSGAGFSDIEIEEGSEGYLCRARKLA